MLLTIDILFIILIFVIDFSRDGGTGRRARLKLV